MILITSISPGHKNNKNQFIALQSWLSLGYVVYSMNSPSEIAGLQDMYPGVEFIPTHRTMEHTWGRPLVCINAMIDFAKDHPSNCAMLINSDIIIKDDHGVLPGMEKRAEKGIEIMNRWDYDEDMNNAKVYPFGFDAFIINKKFYHIFGQTVFCIGQTYWDYWIPSAAMTCNVPIFNEGYKILYHKSHPIQYKAEDWIKMTSYYQWQMKYQPLIKLPQQITNLVHRSILSGFEKGREIK